MMDTTSAAYPADVWKIREVTFDPSILARNETIFALANGYLGLRGNFEEGFLNIVNGTYLNGFYEETPIIYGEIAYGYAKNRQVMLNVADGKIIRLYVGAEPFDLSTGTIIAYERTLDLKEGILTREVCWQSPKGVQIKLKIRRLVSFSRRHIAAIDYSVTVQNSGLPLLVESSINGGVENQAAGTDPRMGAYLRKHTLSTTGKYVEGYWGALVQQTTNSGLSLACGMDHIFLQGIPGDTTGYGHLGDGGRSVSLRFTFPSTGMETIRFTKFIGYCTSREYPRDELMERVRAAVAEAKEAGFDILLSEQKEYLTRFWERADVVIDGDDSLQQGIRYNIFSLLQSAGKDGRTSIAAKGLTGEGYEGHYFWDTEIYALPFFIYTHPEIARTLIRYRLNILDKARERAREMNQQGALFPWRTIGGEETSPYYPAGTAQYHINGDIVYCFRKYMHAHPDDELLLAKGAEMVFETARLWADLGDFIPELGGQFCINEVTGPDEYTALVNNNTYTNLMARYNLQYGIELAELLKARYPEEYARIVKTIGITDAEIRLWQECAGKMRIPFDREKGIHAQDDSFLKKAVWDFASTPKDKYPLLLHYHPLVIYRYQVLKQPDVVLAQVLHPDCFSLAEKKRNFDYYDPLTTGDSSLSPCIQSIAAAELGYTEKAYRYFMRTARMDLDDIHGNVSNGVHTAAMAGTWISLVYGFAGMREAGDVLSFSPRLPEKWRQFSFKLLFRGCLIDITITGDKAVYLLKEGPELTLRHFDGEVRLKIGSPAVMGLAPVLECVVFDLDGVVTDTAEYHFRAWKRLSEEIGAPFDRGFNERLKGVGRMESLELILARTGQYYSEEEKRALTVRKNGYYRELIATITPKDLLPGILPLLRRLKKEGIKTSIASVSHNVWEVVKRLKIEGLIDYIVDPASVIKGKPDPEVFLRAAEHFKVRVENCAGVEDAQAGIEAIKAARMFTVGIGGSLKGADWLLPDTKGLTYEELKRRRLLKQPEKPNCSVYSVSGFGNHLTAEPE
ncbi:MAG: beta-phosphoglucomutase [Spirochaetota bacterium]